MHWQFKKLSSFAMKIMYKLSSVAIIVFVMKELLVGVYIQFNSVCTGWSLVMKGTCKSANYQKKLLAV
jgi:hypothetical protein